MQNTLKLIIFSFLVSLLAACVYKRDLPQGNLITPDMVSQLQPGMSRQQVVQVMGSPLMYNAFDDSRWNYVYRLKDADDNITEKQVSLVFNGNQLADVQTSGDIGASPDIEQRDAPASAAAAGPGETISPMGNPTSNPEGGSNDPTL
ncbi:outer membrane protein assembly factor BamE [Kushneria sp. AK178]